MFKLRYQNETGRVEKPHMIKELRRNIAKCTAILREKQNAKRG
jgi:ribosomal protein L29